MFRSATETKLKSDLDSQSYGKRWADQINNTNLVWIALLIKIKYLETKLATLDTKQTVKRYFWLPLSRAFIPRLIGLLVEVMKLLAEALTEFVVGTEMSGSCILETCLLKARGTRE